MKPGDRESGRAGDGRRRIEDRGLTTEGENAEKLKSRFLSRDLTLMRCDYAARFAIGFTESRNPAAPRTAVRLLSSGLPDSDSMR